MLTARAVFAFCFALESCKTKRIRLERFCMCLVLQKALLATESPTINKIPNIPQCTLPPHPVMLPCRPSFSIFRGSGSETTGNVTAIFPPINTLIIPCQLLRRAVRCSCAVQLLFISKWKHYKTSAISRVHITNSKVGIQCCSVLDGCTCRCTCNTNGSQHFSNNKMNDCVNRDQISSCVFSCIHKYN